MAECRRIKSVSVRKEILVSQNWPSFRLLMTKMEGILLEGTTATIVEEVKRRRDNNAMSLQ